MSFKNWMYSLLFVVTQVMAVGYAHADIAAGLSANAALTAQASYGLAGGGALAGTGYWGGTQACPYRTKTSKSAVNESDDVKQERQEIAKIEKEVKLKKLEGDRADAKLKILSKKLEKFFDSEVYEFVISHMDLSRECKEYKTFPSNGCPVFVKDGTDKPGVTKEYVNASGESASKEVITKCGEYEDVPPALMKSWITSDGSPGYCAANSSRAGGNISPSICKDKSLRPADSPKYKTFSLQECTSALSDYRKERINSEKAKDFMARKNEEIEDRKTAIASKQEMEKLEREYKMKSQLEGGTTCEDCEAAGRAYERPQRDWWSTLANVAGGLGLAWYGKKIDESAQEYNAQLGFPSSSSYGYPFVTAGVYSVINGLAGPGAYGCSGGVAGSGFPYGAAGSYGPLGVNGYGPNGALGGAFGYPGSLYGAPWGGGAYLPGLGLNGSLNGPNGGWPYGFTGQPGVGGPLNGQIGIPANSGGWQSNAICVTWPCNNGLNGAINGAINGQIGIPASTGWPTTGYMNNGGYMNSGYMNNGYMTNNYQLQLMQQQQQQQALWQQQQQQAMWQQQQIANQYYQAQMQQQMQQAYQRQAVQQEAMTVQQTIASLQARLNMLVSTYSSGYNSGGYYGGGSLGTGGFYGGIGGIVSGGIYFGAASSSYYPTSGYAPIGSATTIPGVGIGTTLPGIGTGSRGGR